MNLLIFTIKLSLTELQMGLSGQLNITDAMDELQKSLSMGFVPPGWAAVAYPSLKPLQLWFTDLLRRYVQLKEWTDVATTPACLWISGLFNPMSFLTAIMQKTARADKLPLDNIILRTDVTNDDDPNSIVKAADTGAYINGFFVEGAKWEVGRGGEQGNLADQTLKDLNPPLPVMHVIAVTRDKRQT
jgi:dynein heavy chain